MAKRSKTYSGVQRNDLTARYVRRLLRYVPKTGKFFWNEARYRRIKKGDEAGSPTARGYVTIGIDGHNYLAHRLAYLWMTGKWPKHFIDHRKGKSNRWANIRPATNSENLCYRGKTKYNTSGYKCVYLNKRTGKWYSHITVAKRAKHLGTFDAAKDAAKAYRRAAKHYHGQFAMT